MLYVVQFCGGPMDGIRIRKLHHRPSSITIAFDEGPALMYIQDEVTKHVGGEFLKMVESDYGEKPDAS